MSGKHTKGPWEVTRAEFTDEGVNFEVVMPEQRICALDAKLIAAAPAMLEALEQQLSQWQLISNMVDDDATVTATIEASMQLINNAIRAARGER